MREIKFRFWDKNQNKMIYWGEIPPIKLGNYFYEPWNYIPLQCTGQRDKRDILIYEGDIVKNNWFDNGGNFIGTLSVVEYGLHSTDGEDYYTSISEGFFFNGINGETFSINNLPFDEDRGIEILGNTYENPELLKEQK